MKIVCIYLYIYIVDTHVHIIGSLGIMFHFQGISWKNMFITGLGGSQYEGI